MTKNGNLVIVKNWGQLALTSEPHTAERLPGSGMVLDGCRRPVGVSHRGYEPRPGFAIRGFAEVARSIPRRWVAGVVARHSLRPE
jgi:hypothetical protein